MKIRALDMIGCVWTIAAVDVGQSVYVCCRANPEHTLFTCSKGIDFREWMTHVFEPKVIRKIVAQVIFGDLGDGLRNRSECSIEGDLNRVTESRYRDIYDSFVQWLQDRDNANSRGDSGHAALCIEKAKAMSREIARLEEQIRRKGNKYEM